MTSPKAGSTLFKEAVNLMRGKEVGSLPDECSRLGRLLQAARSSRTSVQLTGWAGRALSQGVRAAGKLARAPVPQFLGDAARIAKEAARKTGAVARRLNRAGMLDRIEQLALEDANVLLMGLRKAQARVLQPLLGKPFGGVKVASALKELREGEQVAAELSAGLETYWRQAAPAGKSAKQAVDEVFGALQKAMAGRNPPNPAEFVREELFDPWRKRFFQQFFSGTGEASGAACDAFLRKLESASGMKVVQGAGEDTAAHFVVELKVGGVPKLLEMDVDHAEQDLAIAVTQALSKGDAKLLRPVVEASSLQLASSRQNRYLFTAVRRQMRKEAVQAARAGRGSAKLRQELKEGLAEAIDTIDEAPDFNR